MHCPYHTASDQFLTHHHGIVGLEDRELRQGGTSPVKVGTTDAYHTVAALRAYVERSVGDGRHCINNAREHWHSACTLASEVTVSDQLKLTLNNGSARGACTAIRLDPLSHVTVFGKSDRFPRKVALHYGQTKARRVVEQTNTHPEACLYMPPPYWVFHTLIIALKRSFWRSVAFAMTSSGYIM